jgi:Uma2 family endonuclease
MRKWLRAFLEEDFVLSEAPIFVSSNDNPTNEPEPDIVVLRRSIMELGSKPAPRDILLVIEIADSSLHLDLTHKAALYARANIAEYWVLDINSRRMIVHRDPQDGAYKSVLAYREDEMLSCLAAPDRQVLVSAFL